MYGSSAPFVDYHVDVLQHGRVGVAIHRLLHDVSLARETVSVASYGTVNAWMYLAM